MARKDFKTIDNYLASLNPDDRAIMQQVRQTIRDAVPEGEEHISYQVPAVKANGGWVFYFSIHTKHYSLSCPPPFTVFDEFTDALSAYELSKSTIRLPKAEPVPVDLIAAMARFRAAENQARAAAKTRPAKP